MRYQIGQGLPRYDVDLSLSGIGPIELYACGFRAKHNRIYVPSFPQWSSLPVGDILLVSKLRES